MQSEHRAVGIPGNGAVTLGKGIPRRAVAATRRRSDSKRPRTLRCQVDASQVPLRRGNLHVQLRPRLTGCGPLTLVLGRRPVASVARSAAGVKRRDRHFLPALKGRGFRAGEAL